MPLNSIDLTVMGVDIVTTENLPWLSILVPAYEYPEGIRRIINSLVANNVPGIECIIRDDSFSDDILKIVENTFQEQVNFSLIYERSQERKGAVNNWNSLLSMARGKYILFMHHDEAPIGIDFFIKLRNELNLNARKDVLILGCLISNDFGVYLRRHMPVFLQSFLLRNFGPNYLLLHNFIGSPSIFVVKRSACQLFDERLKWLVDVEWMSRILQGHSLNWYLSLELCISSFQRAEGSITSTLKGRLKEIERNDIEIICSKETSVMLVSLLLPRKSWEKCLAILDSILWKALRVAVRFQAMLFRNRNPFRFYRSDS